MEFDSQGWYYWECSNELDKNYQLLKDGNVHEDFLFIKLDADLFA